MAGNKVFAVRVEEEVKEFSLELICVHLRKSAAKILPE